jgi:hypothetical protein
MTILVIVSAVLERMYRSTQGEDVLSEKKACRRFKKRDAKSTSKTWLNDCFL